MKELPMFKLWKALVISGLAFTFASIEVCQAACRAADGSSIITVVQPVGTIPVTGNFQQSTSLELTMNLLTLDYYVPFVLQVSITDACGEFKQALGVVSDYMIIHLNTIFEFSLPINRFPQIDYNGPMYISVHMLPVNPKRRLLNSIVKIDNANFS